MPRDTLASLRAERDALLAKLGEKPEAKPRTVKVHGETVAIPEGETRNSVLRTLAGITCPVEGKAFAYASGRAWHMREVHGWSKKQVKAL
jgi:hypothetical protein